MAIKVNGTTVINDSRTLQNVGGLKTVNGTSIVGSGNISAGASTTYGAVGTYGYFLYIINGTSTINTRLTVNQNITTSGSNLRGNAANTSVEYGDQNGYQRLNGVSFNGGGSALSGTWRCMGKATYFINHNRGSGNYAAIWTPLLWVRIS